MTDTFKYPRLFKCFQHMYYSGNYNNITTLTHHYVLNLHIQIRMITQLAIWKG